MRWQTTAEDAVKSLDYTVKDTAGIDDYQGWGTLLLYRAADEQWAVLAWSYGSCSVCDGYEDMGDKERHDAFVSLIETFPNEVAARERWQNSKGW